MKYISKTFTYHVFKLLNICISFFAPYLNWMRYESGKEKTSGFSCVTIRLNNFWIRIISGHARFHNMPHYVYRLSSILVIFLYSVLEQISIKSPYPDQRLPQHESLYHIGLISARIEIPHMMVTFLLRKMSLNVITVKLILY